jgi:hypothetical protein
MYLIPVLYVTVCLKLHNPNRISKNAFTLRGAIAANFAISQIYSKYPHRYYLGNGALLSANYIHCIFITYNYYTSIYTAITMPSYLGTALNLKDAVSRTVKSI